MSEIEHMQKTVLIFGILGFVGRYLAEEFHTNGYEVFGSDLHNDANIPDYVNFYACNLLDGESVCNIIGRIKPSHIVNLAAISSVGASWNIPQDTMNVNVIGAINILEVARKQANLPRVMFIGSSEEYAASDKPLNEQSELNANNPYGISKVTQERFAELYRKQYGMKVYCVRPFNHTGVGQKDSFVLPSFCKQVAEIEKSGKPGMIKVGNLSVKRDFSHVKDIVRAYRMIIESDKCTTYNVGSGTAYGLDEMLQFIIELSSQDIRVEVDKDRFRPVDTPIVCCDRSLIERELGWKPEFTVFEALREMYEDFLTI